MAYGIRIYNSAGALRLDSEDWLTRILHRRFLPANTSGSVSVPGFVPSRGFAIAFLAPGQDFFKFAHRVTTSGTTITYTRQRGNSNDPDTDSGNSILIVGMYR